jgi:hypothetical protein
MLSNSSPGEPLLGDKATTKSTSSKVELISDEIEPKESRISVTKNSKAKAKKPKA